LILLLGIWCGGSWRCTYEPLAPPEMPTFYQTLNLPLVDIALPLADLQDSSNNIYGDALSDSLYFKFSGNLDTTTLTENIFLIPLATSVGFQQDFSTLSQAQPAFNTSISNTVKLSQLLPPPIRLPAPIPITVDEVPRAKLVDEKYSYQIFDRYGIPFFERVDYITIGTGTFETTITNELLVDLDSVLISLVNRDGSILAQTFYERIPAGTTAHDGTPGNLNGKTIRDSIDVQISAIIAGTNGQPLTIPAGADPYLTITADLSIEEVESFTGLPLPIESTQRQPLPASDNTIIRAELGETTTDPPDTNFLSLTIGNEMPFDLGMQIIFFNFYRGTEPLTIDTVINSGESVTANKRLDNYVFRNPDSTTVVDSIIVFVQVTILPEPGDTAVTIPLDVGDSMIDVRVGISALKFKALEGFFNASFSIPPITISNIPTGFTNVDFGAVILRLIMSNEIQARTDLNLVLEGLREGLDPVRIDATETIEKASASHPVTHSVLEIDIAPIFNMVPDSIRVSGEAAIPSDDTSRLQVGSSFWGGYEIIVPFILKIEPMTFIPVKSNVLGPIDKKTKKRIQEGLIESKIVNEVRNDFPFSGSIDILISNYDYFPLEPDSLDSGYVWRDDSLYVLTDTGYFHIEIDTLFRIILPTPVAFDSRGAVSVPGFLHHESALDSNRLNIILKDEKHYIRPRIHLDGTDNFVWVGFNDRIDIVSVFSITMDAGKLLNPEEEAEPDTLPKFNPLSPPLRNSRREISLAR